MNKLYYLSTCSTCKRIINALHLPSNVEMHDLKEHPITTEQLQQLVDLAGNYESLFNKRARLFATIKKEGHIIDEAFFKQHLLKHYHSEHLQFCSLHL